MVRSRFGLKALGLSALVFCLMAMTTGVAQAETGAHWNVDGADVGILAPEVGGEIENSLATLLTKVSGVSVALSCTAGTLKNVKLLSSGSLSKGSVLFTGCITKLNGVTSAPCKPHSAKAEEGTIQSLEGTGLLALHLNSETKANEAVTTITPAVGSTFVNIVLGTEEESECSIGEFLPVSGTLAIKDPQATSELVTHVITEHSLTDMWVLNKTVEHKSTIDGSAKVFLVGEEHEGLEWSGTPG